MNKINDQNKPRILNNSGNLYAIRGKKKFMLYFSNHNLIGELYDRMNDSINFDGGLINQNELFEIAHFIEQLKKCQKVKKS